MTSTRGPRKVSHYKIMKKIVSNRIIVCQWDYISSSNQRNDQAL